MSNLQYDSAETNEVLALPFKLFAEHAGRQAIRDAVANEDDPHGLIRLATHRFDDNLDRFSSSFRYSWPSIGASFRAAARRRIGPRRQ